MDAEEDAERAEEEEEGDNLLDLISGFGNANEDVDSMKDPGKKG